MNNTGFEIKISLGKKFLLSLLISTIILSVIICTVVSLIFRKRIMERYEYVGFSVSDYVASMMNGSIVEHFKEEGMAEIGDDAVYATVKDILYNAANEFDLLYMYIAVPEEGHLYYLWEANSGSEILGFEDAYSPGGEEWSFQMLNNEGERALHTFNDPTYGAVCTAASPIYNEDGKPVALVYADFSLADMVTGIINMIIGTILFIMILMAIYTAFFYYNAKKSIVDPIKELTVSAGELTQRLDDDSAAFVSSINTGDEIEALSHAFENMDAELRKYISENSRIVAEKERIGTELNLAASIQSSSLPSVFPPFPDRKEFDIYATMDPAKEVGGDFYDFFLIDDDHLGLVIADVSDKGIPASLFMMVSKTLINSNTMMGGPTNEVMQRVNNRICETNTNDMFVTVWLGVLEISTGIIHATNAGHEYPCIKHPGGQFEYIKDPHGLVVGAMEGVPYTEYDFKLEHGSTLYVYTDGVPDATNMNNERFGEDRIIGALNKEPEADVTKLLNNMRISIEEFVQEAPQFDDTTMLAIHYF
ncbi:MAG: SpoIIE family protein phosphatase [Lachnospiraceae bacterium]|nr:SpoIIE family protein phosphatase [Lachnospiraceae bacterium]